MKKRNVMFWSIPAFAVAGAMVAWASGNYDFAVVVVGLVLLMFAVVMSFR